MSLSHRREFLADVGKGMLVAGIGSTLAYDLGLANAFAEETTRRLDFGKLESLVSLIQESPLDKLLPALMVKHTEGTDLKTLVAATSLANARTFGGQDYTGYHSFMALPPALEMSRELPEKERAVPVLKVIYRNAQRIHAFGGSKREVLHPMSDEHNKLEEAPEALRELTRKPDMDGSEKLFAKLATHQQEAFDALQIAIQDEVDVHRVVLSWRAWTMIDIAGKDYAHTLLRQSVRYCVDAEKQRIDRKRPASGIRTVLPKLLDQHKLVGMTLGTKKPDDAWMLKMAETIYGAGRDKAAEAVAMALAEGFAPESIGEAMSMASTMLVLRDPGRKQDEDGKPKGSVHGASVGVHASDSANAWRNIARVSNQRNTVASLIVGAYHTAGQSVGQNKEPYPLFADMARANSDDPAKLLEMLDSAIRGKDQALACAAALKYGQGKNDVEKLFSTLIKYAISEDGALHAEKYYRTIREEYVATREAYRLSHIVALARVTASEFGFPAPGYAECKRLTKS